MEYWSAKELDKEFNVVASFYRTEIGNELFQCRNHALVFRKGISSNQHPDAMIIMANPGSCSPKDPSYQAPIIQETAQSIPYVQAKVDPTQRQIMRLMLNMNWKIVSIINLSDLCTGSMQDFGRMLSVAKNNQYDNHSIFSDARIEERQNSFMNHKKIILAWGKNSIIRELACEALGKLPETNPIFGLAFDNPKWGYRHPFPMLEVSCKAWLREMCQQLENNNPPTRRICSKGTFLQSLIK